MKFLVVVHGWHVHSKGFTTHLINAQSQEDANQQAGGICHRAQSDFKKTAFVAVEVGPNETVRGWARMMARVSGSITADDLREKADAEGLAPNHHNAWGAVFQGPDWIMVGYEPSVRPSSKGRMIRRWRFQEGGQCSTGNNSEKGAA